MTLCDYVYDAIAATISLADLATDIMVIYGYWINSRMVFFTISIIIVILAQVTYAFWFAARYAEHLEICSRILTFFFVLPFAPFISFVFMGTLEDDSMCSKALKGIGLEVASWGLEQDCSELKMWMKKKFAKHFIFIQEAVIEAFPQSILQLIALVYYQETEFSFSDPFTIINIVSILISITSISSKALIASANALNVKFMLFNWFLICTDFFGIFFICSWVFYQPITQSIIGQFFLYKSLICNASLIIIVGIPLSIKAWYTTSDDHVFHRDSFCGQCCLGMVVTVFFITLWIGGSGIMFMLSKIMLFSFLPMIAVMALDKKINASGKIQPSVWNRLLTFIGNARTKNDTKLRIACVNMVLLHNKQNHRGRYRQYFDKHELTLYKEMELSEMRQYFDRSLFVFLRERVITFVRDIWFDAHDANNDIFDNIRLYLILFVIIVLLPLYLVSRMINLVFPIVIFFYVYSMDIWSDISLLQYVFSCIYFVLLLLVFVVSYFALQQLYYIWHLLPGIEPVKCMGEADVNIVEDYYHELVDIPQREEMLNQIFGKDIAVIVCLYLPHCLDDILKPSV